MRNTLAEFCSYSHSYLIEDKLDRRMVSRLLVFKSLIHSVHHFSDLTAKVPPR